MTTTNDYDKITGTTDSYDDHELSPSISATSSDRKACLRQPTIAKHVNDTTVQSFRSFEQPRTHTEKVLQHKSSASGTSKYCITGRDEHKVVPPPPSSRNPPIDRTRAIQRRFREIFEGCENLGKEVRKNKAWAVDAGRFQEQ